MFRLGRKIGSTFDSAVTRADNGSGRVLRSRLYGVEAESELAPFGPRQGTNQVTAPYRLDRESRFLAVVGKMLRSDKTADNSYSVTLETSSDGESWVPLVEGAAHSSLAPHSGGKKDGRERSVRLQVELGTPLPAGTYLRLKTTLPNTVRMSLTVEVR